MKQMKYISKREEVPGLYPSICLHILDDINSFLLEDRTPGVIFNPLLLFILHIQYARTSCWLPIIQPLFTPPCHHLGLSVISSLDC